MALEFRKPTAQDAQRIIPFFSMRPNRTCDSGWLDTFIWTEYYHIRYCIADDRALLLLMKNSDEFFSAIPYCAEEELPHYFDMIREYFNSELKKPFKIYLADEEGVEALRLKENPDYIVREEEDLKDYLYSGEELRTLPGKRFQKKRNLINKFVREYQGRWEYRHLQCDDRADIEAFMRTWYTHRMEEEIDAADVLQYEWNGILSILEECCHLNYQMGGIFIDGRMEAFSIAGYNPLEKMACVSVEKANPAIPGIYQVINYEFLRHEFPEAELVNREDDMGLDGLRRAKLSYHPIGYERKYMVLQKTFAGYQAELADRFEDEIQHYEHNAD